MPNVFDKSWDPAEFNDPHKCQKDQMGGYKGLIQNHMWHIRRAIFMEKYLYLCFGNAILYEWARLQPREPRHFAQSRNYVPLWTCPTLLSHCGQLRDFPWCFLVNMSHPLLSHCGQLREAPVNGLFNQYFRIFKTYSYIMFHYEHTPLLFHCEHRIREPPLMFHYEHVSTLLSHCGREDFNNLRD
jgi:hypothetical protein